MDLICLEVWTNISFDLKYHYFVDKNSKAILIGSGDQTVQLLISERVLHRSSINTRTNLIILLSKEVREKHGYKEIYI